MIHIVFGDLEVVYQRYKKRQDKYLKDGVKQKRLIEKQVLLVKSTESGYVIVEQKEKDWEKKLNKHLSKSQRIVEVKALIYTNLKKRPAYQYEVFETDFKVQFTMQLKES